MSNSVFLWVYQTYSTYELSKLNTLVTKLADLLNTWQLDIYDLKHFAAFPDKDQNFLFVVCNIFTTEFLWDFANYS